ncbi:hypothetical protein H696_03413 [Fonticula alba]|uniref:Uncharacterized protein n=1 Tax=Fonticula alba TaxID=691883 RepID=A0A058Z7Q7_FONAL|nr:hypothetical protein H696_03413 [Fonticula alba]KCV69948.1 hypothetical protein H696_03413 [Fonticula alba]|eukprot:XP_009495554.1 hypothetical protein H696_03413 [Fonticula alba]
MTPLENQALRGLTPQRAAKRHELNAPPDPGPGLVSWANEVSGQDNGHLKTSTPDKPKHALAVDELALSLEEAARIVETTSSSEAESSAEGLPLGSMPRSTKHPRATYPSRAEAPQGENGHAPLGPGGTARARESQRGREFLLPPARIPVGAGGPTPGSEAAHATATGKHHGGESFLHDVRLNPVENFRLRQRISRSMMHELRAACATLQLLKSVWSKRVLPMLMTLQPETPAERETVRTLRFLWLDDYIESIELMYQRVARVQEKTRANKENIRRALKRMEERMRDSGPGSGVEPGAGGAAGTSLPASDQAMQEKHLTAWKFVMPLGTDATAHLLPLIPTLERAYMEYFTARTNFLTYRSERIIIPVSSSIIAAEAEIASMLSQASRPFNVAFSVANAERLVDSVVECLAFTTSGSFLSRVLMLPQYRLVRMHQYARFLVQLTPAVTSPACAWRDRLLLLITRFAPQDELFRQYLVTLDQPTSPSSENLLDRRELQQMASACMLDSPTLDRPPKSDAGPDAGWQGPAGQASVSKSSSPGASFRSVNNTSADTFLDDEDDDEEEGALARADGSPLALIPGVARAAANVADLRFIRKKLRQFDQGIGQFAKSVEGAITMEKRMAVVMCRLAVRPDAPPPDDSPIEVWTSGQPGSTSASATPGSSADSSRSSAGRSGSRSTPASQSRTPPLALAPAEERLLNSETDLFRSPPSPVLYIQASTLEDALSEDVLEQGALSQAASTLLTQALQYYLLASEREQKALPALRQLVRRIRHQYLKPCWDALERANAVCSRRERLVGRCAVLASGLPRPTVRDRSARLFGDESQAGGWATERQPGLERLDARLAGSRAATTTTTAATAATAATVAARATQGEVSPPGGAHPIAGGRFGEGAPSPGSSPGVPSSSRPEDPVPTGLPPAPPMSESSSSTERSSDENSLEAPGAHGGGPAARPKGPAARQAGRPRDPDGLLESRPKSDSQQGEGISSCDAQSRLERSGLGSRGGAQSVTGPAGGGGGGGGNSSSSSHYRPGPLASMQRALEHEQGLGRSRSSLTLHRNRTGEPDKPDEPPVAARIRGSLAKGSRLRRLSRLSAWDTAPENGGEGRHADEADSPSSGLGSTEPGVAAVTCRCDPTAAGSGVPRCDNWTEFRRLTQMINEDVPILVKELIPEIMRPASRILIKAMHAHSARLRTDYGAILETLTHSRGLYYSGVPLADILAEEHVAPVDFGDPELGSAERLDRRSRQSEMLRRRAANRHRRRPQPGRASGPPDREPPPPAGTQPPGRPGQGGDALPGAESGPNVPGPSPAPRTLWGRQVVRRPANLFSGRADIHSAGPPTRRRAPGDHAVDSVLGRVAKSLIPGSSSEELLTSQSSSELPGPNWYGATSAEGQSPPPAGPRGAGGSGPASGKQARAPAAASTVEAPPGDDRPHGPASLSGEALPPGHPPAAGAEANARQRQKSAQSSRTARRDSAGRESGPAGKGTNRYLPMSASRSDIMNPLSRPGHLEKLQRNMSFICACYLRARRRVVRSLGPMLQQLRIVSPVAVRMLLVNQPRQTQAARYQVKCRYAMLEAERAGESAQSARAAAIAMRPGGFLSSHGGRSKSTERRLLDDQAGIRQPGGNAGAAGVAAAPKDSDSPPPRGPTMAAAPADQPTLAEDSGTVTGPATDTPAQPSEAPAEAGTFAPPVAVGVSGPPIPTEDAGPAIAPPASPASLMEALPELKKGGTEPAGAAMSPAPAPAPAGGDNMPTPASSDVSPRRSPSSMTSLDMVKHVESLTNDTPHATEPEAILPADDVLFRPVEGKLRLSESNRSSQLCNECEFSRSADMFMEIPEQAHTAGPADGEARHRSAGSSPSHVFPKTGNMVRPASACQHDRALAPVSMGPGVPPSTPVGMKHGAPPREEVPTEVIFSPLQPTLDPFHERDDDRASLLSKRRRRALLLRSQSWPSLLTQAAKRQMDTAPGGLVGVAGWLQCRSEPWRATSSHGATPPGVSPPGATPPPPSADAGQTPLTRHMDGRLGPVPLGTRPAGPFLVLGSADSITQRPIIKVRVNAPDLARAESMAAPESTGGAWWQGAIATGLEREWSGPHAVADALPGGQPGPSLPRAEGASSGDFLLSCQEVAAALVSRAVMVASKSIARGIWTREPSPNPVGGCFSTVCKQRAQCHPSSMSSRQPSFTDKPAFAAGGAGLLQDFRVLHGHGAGLGKEPALHAAPGAGLLPAAPAVASFAQLVSDLGSPMPRLSAVLVTYPPPEGGLPEGRVGPGRGGVADGGPVAADDEAGLA